MQAGSQQEALSSGVRERSWSGVLLDVLIYGFVGLFALFCFLPLWLVIIASLTDEAAILKYGYTLWPAQWSFEAYRLVFSGGTVADAYQVSIFTTVVGTLVSVATMAALAYGLASTRMKNRNFISLFVYFTMVFSGGLLPWYVVMTKVLGLQNTIWALILPPLFQPFWLFVMRNFFRALPRELLEAAWMDGANDFVILLRIVLPLSTPVIATVSLFIAVMYWNDWFTAAILTSIKNLPLLVIQMINNIAWIQTSMQYGGKFIRIPARALQMATVVMTIGPIVLLYPFLQRYFVRGLTLGGIK
jgi:ABC-type glycerol-3-phosphate transport system permease component